MNGHLSCGTNPHSSTAALLRSMEAEERKHGGRVPNAPLSRIADFVRDFRGWLGFIGDLREMTRDSDDKNSN